MLVRIIPGADFSRRVHLDVSWSLSGPVSEFGITNLI
jgi:hypothetical protein